MDFLVQNNLIKKQISEGKDIEPKVFYSITEKGQMVVKLFEEVDRSLKIMANATKD